eukprot:g22408.t1
MSRSPESDGNLLDLDGDEFMSVDGDDEDASFEDADGGEVEASTSLLEFLGDAFSTFTMSRWRPSRAQHGERIVFEVWELQRRTTMFHDDWRAPFLPHDGQKTLGGSGHCRTIVLRTGSESGSTTCGANDERTSS